MHIEIDASNHGLEALHPPCGESYRLGGKVRKRTLANLPSSPPACHRRFAHPAARRQHRRRLGAELRGGAKPPLRPMWPRMIGDPAPVGTRRAISIRAPRARPGRGHDRRPHPQSPHPKLATARGLGEEAPLSTLVEELGLAAVDERRNSTRRQWIGLSCDRAA